jgi:hypothetical protein
VNLAPATAEAAGFRSGGDVVAESVVYDTDAADGWLVGYGTAEKVDGRSYSNAARVLPGGGESTTTVVGIPKAAFEETLGVTLAELQDGADVRLAVATGPGVVAFRRSQAVEVDVDSETFADLDAQLLLEDEQ